MTSIDTLTFHDWQQRCLADGQALIIRTLRAAGLSAQGGLQEAWQAQLSMALSHPATRGAAPTVASQWGSLSGVMLMSDEEVSEGILVSRIVQNMSTATDWLLLDIQTRAQTWTEDARAAGHDSAALLTPSLLADTLCEALKRCVPLLDRRLDLLGVISAPLIRLMTPIYEQQVEWLELHGLGSSPLSPHGQSLSAQTSQAPKDIPTLTEVLPPALPDKPVGITASQVPALLARMADQSRLDAGMTVFMAELAAPIQTSVQAFPDMLGSERSTVWRLVERLTALGQLYPLYRPGKLPLEQRLKPLLERLKRNQPAKDADYQRVLDHVEQLHQAALQAAAAAHKPDEAELNAEERRDELEPLIQFQVMDRLRGLDLQPSIRQFLLGPWVQVISRSSALDGVDSASAQRWAKFMDDLIEGARLDLSKPLSPAALECLLMEARDGLLSMGTAAERIQQHEADLMQELGEWPRAKTPRRRPSPIEPVVQDDPVQEAAPAETPSAAADSASSEEATTVPVQAGPASQAPAVSRPTGFDDILSSRWARHAELETVPQVLSDDPPDSPARQACAAWLNSLTTGQLCRIFIQGHWTSARLDWISDRQRFYSFSRPRATPFFASRRVLERMRTEGLITTIQPGQWLRAAADSLPMDMG